MNTTELHRKFAGEMAQNGIQYRIVPIDRLRELAEQIGHTLEEEITDPDFAEYVGYAYNFGLLEKFPELTSVIVASRFNTVNTVDFAYQDKTITVLLPPGYVHFRTKQAILQKTMLETLTPLGCKCERIIVPVKLLAACSGLAKYGRNNISYVPGFGSHHFLGSFITDLPVETDTWIAAETMPECSECQACITNCPTGAIGADRFLIHGERCLTYFNRNPGTFPDWLLPEWHNSLVGCMRCQDVCPVNAPFAGKAVALTGFDMAETEILLATGEFEDLPAELKVRFEQFGFPELHSFILRNLRVLIG